MNAETQAVLFNAVPLLILAALYLAAGLMVAPALWRERGHVRGIGIAMALIFPCVGLAATVVGVETLVTQEAPTGRPLLALAGILLAGLPLLAVGWHWRDLSLFVTGRLERESAPEQEKSRLERERAGVGRLSHLLLDADKPAGIARVLLDELTGLFDLDVANLALVEDDGRRARIISARERGEDNPQLLDASLSLKEEASGISTVVREGAAFAVYDAESSPIVNKRLNAITNVKSCAFVPVRARGDVIGVVFAAVRRPRLFDLDELVLMETLASEAGLALERSRAAHAVADALERERLIVRISRAVRSRRDLDELLQVAVQETANATHVERCFIRLGEHGEPTPVLREWAVPGIGPLGDASRLPAVNLAVRERQTIAIGDVLQAPELDDPTLGDVGELTQRSIRAVLATPIVAFARDRRARPAPVRAGKLDTIRDLARGSGRTGGRDRHRHEPAAPREHAPGRRSSAASTGSRPSSASRCPRGRRSTRSPRLRRRRSAASRSPCSAPVGDELALAGGHSLAVASPRTSRRRAGS